MTDFRTRRRIPAVGVPRLGQRTLEVVSKPPEPRRGGLTKPWATPRVTRPLGRTPSPAGAKYRSCGAPSGLVQEATCHSGPRPLAWALLARPFGAGVLKQPLVQRFFARIRRGLRMTDSIPLFRTNHVRVSRLACIVQGTDAEGNHAATGLRVGEFGCCRREGLDPLPTPVRDAALHCGLGRIPAVHIPG